MTIEEVFNQVAQRMVEGLMTHSQLADYFGFLGLDGYQQCHIYHFFEENCNYKKIERYFLDHYNKLIKDMPVQNPNIIPEDQFQYSRQQVTKEIRKEAVRAGFDKQVYQEKGTKKFYEQCYQNLIQMNEIAGAEELAKYIKDVDYELAEAVRIFLKLESIDYDMSDIMMLQDDIKKEYRKRMKEIEVC